ncbi:MAG: hypothetical protein V4610_15485 [Pseudomonadota bacterium]
MRETDWARARTAHADELGLTRRAQMTGMFSAFVAVALASEVAVARPLRRVSARDWIDRQDELGRALKRGEIKPADWMAGVGQLAREIDVAQLMAEVDHARVGAFSVPPTNDPRKRSVRFIDDKGEPRRLIYAAALFDFSPANVITPHGHRHMVSSHLVVAGCFRVRNFDRIRDEEHAMIIRPTRDAVASVGTLSAMSADRDNIHWFVPQGGPARTFDVIISGLDAGQPDYDIQAIDPLGGKRMRDGSIVAPIMTFEDASAKYTNKA